jgi:hypothetical protein
MPTRTVVLTALIASCVSSLVTLTVALLVLAPGIRAAPDPQAVQPVVRAERFEMLDAAGRVRAVLSTERHGAGLALIDENNQQRIALVVDPDAQSGLSGLFVGDTTTQGQAFIGGSFGDSPSFAVRVTNGERQAAFVRAGTDGVGFIAAEPGNRPRARMVLNPQSVVGVEVGPSLLDPATARAALVQGPGLTPRLGVIDESGQPIWSAP